MFASTDENTPAVLEDFSTHFQTLTSIVNDHVETLKTFTHVPPFSSSTLPILSTGERNTSFQTVRNQPKLQQISWPDKRGRDDFDILCGHPDKKQKADPSSSLENRNIANPMKRSVNKYGKTSPKTLVVPVKPKLVDSASAPASHHPCETSAPSLLEPPFAVANVAIDSDDHVGGAPCLIEKLLTKPFDSKLWTDEEKLTVIAGGRPLPYTKYLTKALFEKFPWLTNCSKLNKLFCWPCMLLVNNDLWCVSANITDIQSMSNGNGSGSRIELSADKHNVTPKHVEVVSVLAYWEECLRNQLSQAQVLVSSENPKSESESNNCIIEILLHKDFLSPDWTDEDRFNIISKEKPSANLKMYHELYPKGLLHDKVYQKSWLSGSLALKRWYCWPCLLFVKTNLWFETGEGLSTDSSVNVHEATFWHKYACTQLQLWESKVNERITQHTIDDIRGSWAFFKHFINLICMEKKKRNNEVVYADTLVSLLETFVRVDDGLKKCINERASDCGNSGLGVLVSNHTPGVLASIEFLMREKMKEELRVVPSVFLILSDTSYVVNKSVISVVLRYVRDGGNVIERFIRFLKFENNRSPKVILKQLQSTLKELNCHKKLIGFTYDGAVIAPSEILEFNDAMRYQFPLSDFFRYEEHNWNIIFHQALTHLYCCRIFLLRIADLSDFIRTTPSLQNLVDSGGKLLDFTTWDVPSGFLAELNRYHCAVVYRLELITSIMSEGTPLDIVDNEGIALAFSFLEFLTSARCCFMLVFINTLFSHFAEFAATCEKGEDLDDFRLQMSYSLLVRKLNFQQMFATASVMSKKWSKSDSQDSIQYQSEEAYCKESFNQVLATTSLLIKNTCENAEGVARKELPIMSSSQNTSAVRRMSAYLEGKPKSGLLNSTDAFIWMEKDLLENLQKMPFFHGKVMIHYLRPMNPKDSEHSSCAV